MRMREKSFTNAPNEISLSVIFGEHGLGSLEQKYMALRIYRDCRGLSGDRVFGEFEKVGHDTIRKLGDGLERGGFDRCWLCPDMEGQECTARQQDFQRLVHISSLRGDSRHTNHLHSTSSERAASIDFTNLLPRSAA